MTRYCLARSALFAVPMLAIAAVVAPIRAQSFEGIISMNLSQDRGSQNEMRYLIRKGLMRMEVDSPMGSVAMIMDPASGKTTMLIPERQMYMEISSDAGRIAEQVRQRGSNADMKATGKMETIAGFRCEHYLGTADDGKQFDVCLAKGIGGFMMGTPMGRVRGGGGGGGDGMSAWAKKLGTDLFPLRVQQVGGGVVMEVTSIEKKSLDDSLFKVPDGYVNMTSMMGRPPH